MKPVRVLQLYPRHMNIYGDEGNALVLRRRLEWYGFAPHLLRYDVGDAFPDDVDVVLGGGGQDSGQGAIQEDLLAIGPRLRELADDGTPMLVICGMYQLFGHFFRTREGAELTGVGVLDVETYGKDERLIGNVVATSEEFGEVVGYENHSGQTFLGPQAQPFARVTRGAGNNTADDTEGARYRNVIGSYLHGSLLPKNPRVADFLIGAAVERRYREPLPAGAVDDSLAELAREVARSRPR